MADKETERLIDPSLDRRMLLALVDASQALNDDLAQSTVFQKIAEKATRVLRAEGASVLTLDTQKDELLFVTATGPAADKIKGKRVKASEGIAGQALRTRRAVRVDSVQQNRNFFPGIDAETKMHTRGLMAAPLIDRDQVMGVVEVINPLDRDNFDDADLELLRVFANLAAAATRNARVIDRISRENACLRTAAPQASMVGNSPGLNATLALCKKVAAVPTTVLVTGETGTGKEMAAQTIHRHSKRSDKPFIAVNCAALTETLLESELFGHEKGAFTGAADRKLGRFELAEGGTLFLDEVGEMSPASQTKLLRVLQEQEFTRVGGTDTISCDVRIIAATNRDLRAEADAGRFREDLYYRLNIFPIHLPPLRDRRDDVMLLVDYFIQEVAPKLGVHPPAVAPDVATALMRYDWPGNIRELRNVVERCTLLAEGTIELKHLPAEIAQPDDEPAGSMPLARHGRHHGQSDDADAAPPLIVTTGKPMTSKLAEQECRLLVEALEQINWNQSAAARVLGISRDHVRYRMKKYGIQKPAKR